jgi:S-adenosylmethionine:tRNA ribosyltransferase-isomerase
LQNKGVKVIYITLHVGGGTFLPVRTEKIENHKMHSEFFIISQDVCDIINTAKAQKKRVISVGTTSTRAIETAAHLSKSVLQPQSEYTNLFIKPGYKFKIIDGMITNFHLPKSTLFILVCTLLGGVENGRLLYKYAIEKKYRFFSYGDACFLMLRK